MTVLSRTTLPRPTLINTVFLKLQCYLFVKSEQLQRFKIRVLYLCNLKTYPRQIIHLSLEFSVKLSKRNHYALDRLADQQVVCRIELGMYNADENEF